MSFFGSSWEDPKTAAVLGLAQGLLQGNAGAGLQQGLLGYQRQSAINSQNARQQKLDARDDEQYAKQAKIEAEHEAIRARLREQFKTLDPRFQGMNGPTPAAAGAMGKVDPGQLIAYELAQADPIKYGGAFADTLKPKEPKYQAMGDTLLAIGPNGIKEAWKKPEQIDPNKPFMMRDGQIVANPAYQQFELEKASRSAARTNVSVNTEKSLLNSMAGDLGKELVNERGAARGAVSTINTVNTLKQALDSGKVLAGPATPFARYGLQIGNVLGINGKDANDTLQKTRQAMQSLAQLELDAAAQMKGQGQITESERAILRKAASGDVDSMTPLEIRTLADSLDKVARSRIQNYQRQIEPMVSNPNAAPLAPFLGVDVPAPYQPSVVRKPGGQSGGARFLGFE